MDREPTDRELRRFGNIELKDWVLQKPSGTRGLKRKHILNTMKGECSLQWLRYNTGINESTLKIVLFEMLEEGIVDMWKNKRKWRIKKCA